MNNELQPRLKIKLAFATSFCDTVHNIFFLIAFIFGGANSCDSADIERKGTLKKHNARIGGVFKFWSFMLRIFRMCDISSRCFENHAAVDEDQYQQQTCHAAYHYPCNCSIGKLLIRGVGAVVKWRVDGEPGGSC